jgi:hypothetical protein
MSLPARQRRRLEGIEDKLRSSDPRLAAMFAMFGRLTRDEDMPRIEELRHRAAVLALRIRLWLAAVRGRLGLARRRPGDPLAPGPHPGHRARSGRRGTAGRRRWRPVAVFFPLALVLMSLAIFVAARFGSAPRCVAATVVATAKLHPKSKPLAKAGGSKAASPRAASSKAARRCRPSTLTPVPAGR